MNSDIVAGNWKELMGKAQAKWGKLSNDQIAQVNGNLTLLSGMIQKEYGIAQDEADRQVKAWQTNEAA